MCVCVCVCVCARPCLPPVPVPVPMPSQPGLVNHSVQEPLKEQYTLKGSGSGQMFRSVGFWECFNCRTFPICWGAVYLKGHVCGKSAVFISACPISLYEIGMTCVGLNILTFNPNLKYDHSSFEITTSKHSKRFKKAELFVLPSS